MSVTKRALMPVSRWKRSTVSFKTPSRRCGVHVDGLHLLHQFPQLEHFFAQQALDPAQFATDRPIRLGLSPHYVHLHFHRNERLHRTIMQFPGDSRALDRAGPPAQPVQEVHVIDRRPYLPHQAQQKSQLLLPLSPPEG